MLITNDKFRCYSRCRLSVVIVGADFPLQTELTIMNWLSIADWADNMMLNSLLNGKWYIHTIQTTDEFLLLKSWLTVDCNVNCKIHTWWFDGPYCWWLLRSWCELPPNGCDPWFAFFVWGLWIHISFQNKSRLNLSWLSGQSSRFSCWYFDPHQKHPLNPSGWILRWFGSASLYGCMSPEGPTLQEGRFVGLSCSGGWVLYHFIVDSARDSEVGLWYMSWAVSSRLGGGSVCCGGW